MYLLDKKNAITDPEEVIFIRIWFYQGVCRWFRFAQLAKGKKSRP